jgi:hypothetical protein
VLELRNLEVGYGAIVAVRGVALIGRNGAV